MMNRDNDGKWMSLGIVLAVTTLVVVAFSFPGTWASRIATCILLLGFILVAIMTS